MGICESKPHNAYQEHKNPDTKGEIYELYSCLIKIVKNNQTIVGFFTRFFCEINDNNIPFKKALFTNNHILNKISIAINKEIIFENCGQKKRIKITKNRRVFTNEELYYTCIEIFDADNINKFFSIDNTIFNNKSELLNNHIFIL